MLHYPDWIQGASWEGREEKAELGLGFTAGNETQKTRAARPGLGRWGETPEWAQPENLVYLPRAYPASLSPPLL